MNDILNEFQIVVIKDPYSTIENDFTQSIFSKMLALKKAGYSRAYGKDSLPLGVEDFTSAHLLLCEKDGHKPVMGIRATDYLTCKKYKTNFPPLDILDPILDRDHYQVIKNIIAESEKKKINLGYSGGWTIAPEMHPKRELMAAIKEVTAAVMYFYYVTNGIKEVVGGAVTGYKVDKKLHNPLGFKNITLNGADLPPIDCRLINGNQVIWQHLTAFTPEAKELAERYRFFWNQRLEIIETEADKNHLIAKAE
ncbi:MAG: hypothetical protein JNM93_05065 [Bacteriovoracaceae bacterium]|nr:hypothetical protein [Bacteriovoracaceae bacterium]